MEGISPNQSAPDSEKLRSAVEKLKQEVFKPEPLPKRTLPWFIDIFLYPFSLSGIINLVIFIVTPLLIKFVILGFLDLFSGFMTLIFYLLFLGYFFYYIGYCVFDSSKGGLRAPDINLYDLPDKTEFCSQVFLIIGAVAVCLFPAIVYYIGVQHGDLVFWILAALGIFFLPMVMLMAVLFDSVNALNPFVIISSIAKTFMPYCGFVLIFFVFTGFVLSPLILHLPTPNSLVGGLSYVSSLMYYLLGTGLFAYKLAFIYLAFISSHLLGRFYLKYKNILDWGI